MRAYPKVKDTPNRKSRKSQRRIVFYENKIEGNRLRKERRDSKKEAASGTSV